MQYVEHIYTKKFGKTYPKFTFNWMIYILSGSFLSKKNK